MNDLIILVPVYNDWACFEKFCAHPAFQQQGLPAFNMIVVNDGSFNTLPNKKDYPFNIEIIHLHSNIGHQKALAVGLSYIYHHRTAKNIIVMDADGEDNPSHIAALLAAAQGKPQLISAKRIGRKEPFSFKAGYYIYKALFRILTGRRISFGNFTLIPAAYLNKLIYANDIWNHLAAGIIKSGLPQTTVPLERSRRLGGSSKMGYNKLILHGLGAIAVFIESVCTRLLIFSLVLLTFAAISIATIFTIKTFTDRAIPGWASSLISVMFIIFLQGFLLTMFVLFLYLVTQSQRQLIPGIHYKEFISTISKHERSA